MQKVEHTTVIVNKTLYINTNYDTSCQHSRKNTIMHIVWMIHRPEQIKYCSLIIAIIKHFLIVLFLSKCRRSVCLTDRQVQRCGIIMTQNNTVSQLTDTWHHSDTLFFSLSKAATRNHSDPEWQRVSQASILQPTDIIMTQIDTVSHKRTDKATRNNNDVSHNVTATATWYHVTQKKTLYTSTLACQLRGLIDWHIQLPHTILTHNDILHLYVNMSWHTNWYWEEFWRIKLTNVWSMKKVPMTGLSNPIPPKISWNKASKSV